MTPTPTLLLLTALFWTLPATAAVLTYRKHGSSIENVTAALQDRIDDLLTTPQPQTVPQPDA
jgi:hypothetical protein